VSGNRLLLRIAPFEAVVASVDCLLLLQQPPAAQQQQQQLLPSRLSLPPILLDLSSSSP
jgi:hypothetical protein